MCIRDRYNRDGIWWLRVIAFTSYTLLEGLCYKLLARNWIVVCNILAGTANIYRNVVPARVVARKSLLYWSNSSVMVCSSEDKQGMDRIWELTLVARKWLILWSSSLMVCYMFGRNLAVVVCLWCVICSAGTAVKIERMDQICGLRVVAYKWPFFLE